MKGAHLYNGRYTLADAIGSSGFATVFRAQENGRAEAVAIKICARHDDPLFAKSVMREAELIHRFDHENIVRLHLIPRPGKTGAITAHAVELPYNPVFFVMECMNGGSLHRFMAQVGLLPPDEAVSIGLEVARALHHIHRKGYAHNDLKLENVLFRQPVVKGQKYQPVLVDFGVATRVTPPVAGTLYIMSPEQVAEGSLQMAPRTGENRPPENRRVGPGRPDVPAVGRRPCPDDKRADSLTSQIMQARPRSLQQLSPEVSPYLDQLIIDGCLAKSQNTGSNYSKLVKNSGAWWVQASRRKPCRPAAHSAQTVGFHF
ncbi:MAG: serine/threonine protein kinase [Chloroflexi bacterium]|nr:serine/threonine protein kinase [Chloroflexota bacterium]